MPPVARETLANWYRAADVVTVPSYSESFGLVAIEAQACGAPVVAAAVGGLPTAVGDAPECWSTGTTRTLVARRSNGCSTTTRTALAAVACGLAHATGFSWERTTSRLLESMPRRAPRAPVRPRSRRQPRSANRPLALP